MPVEEVCVNNIMGGIENTGGIRQHSHKKKLTQRYNIIQKLGQGTFGKVKLGINKETGQEVAIKTIKKSKISSEADLVRIRREIQIMSSVQHPNIIHIYEVFENKEKMVLVMEYAAGGELYDYLSERKVLTEQEARRIFRQIATACYYCHKHKICHRDLKLENILLDKDNNAKIADFGLSNVFDDQRLLNTFCGSPLYASPEIVKGVPYHGPEVDCWSLGVLLYTLVYGAMPFDGSNFKRLMRQISQGDYFEPSNPSRASPLIRDMLTVNPKKRADIEKICTHWWVNEEYDDNCLDISEKLANQTPVRLDVLLSLAPPPPQLESDKLLVMDDVNEDGKQIEANNAPTRSQSVGSLMELSHPEKRIKDMLVDESPKRKLESTISTDQIEDKGRKEKIIKENTVADITVHSGANKDEDDETMITEAAPLNKSLTKTISKDMDVQETDPQLEGAVCAEILKEAEKKAELEKPRKVKRTLSTSVSSKQLEGINEIPSQENVANNLDKENIKETSPEVGKKEKEPSTDVKTPTKKVVKKKVLKDKNENAKSKSEISKLPTKVEETKPKEEVKPERRSSRIFEAAEKFQNLLSPTENKPTPTDKPKKIIIPGVSVDGFKKEFERKASLTSTSPPKLEPTKKSPESDKDEKSPPKTMENDEIVEPEKTEDDRQERVRNAVNIISSALDKEGTRKSKSRPCMVRKPPVPFGVGGRSASGNIGMLTSPVANSSGPKPFVKPQYDKPVISEAKKVEDLPEPVEEDQTSSAEITLKSATLPRRRTTKAEIQLNYPMPKPATMEFKTEMAHNIEASPKSATQRSEVVMPVHPPSAGTFRSTSVEPEQMKASPKERIIPISFEKPEPPPPKPPVARVFQTQKSTQSQRSNSLSRQSTQDSDTDTVPSSTGEPIKKSPREFIIPIAVEGGGYVTPRAGSLEPSDTASTTSTLTNKSRSKFGRSRRMNSLFNDRDSEDECSPFSSLHRHSSFGKDSDTEDSRRDAFHLLRSSRPKKATLEHNDSLSSGEEDDDEGFEILTAENLFSTLLSRVRDLTQKLNVDDRPGFPSSRLLSHFDHGTNFFRRMDPLNRHSSLGRTFSHERPTSNSSSSTFGTPWRRSVSRDLASDIESVFGERPRGDNTSKNENLNLADLDLKKLKLSEEDALALSFLTPGLSRRIQKQLLAQLAPSEAKKLQRTISARTSDDILPSDRQSTTLPRRYTLKKREKSVDLDDIKETSGYKSCLPIKRDEYRPHYEFNIRSSSIGSEPRGDYKFLYNRKPYNSRSTIPTSPESSLSESFSRNDDSTSYKKDTTDSISDLNTSTRSYTKYDSRFNNKSYDYDTNKTDLNKIKPSTRRISRFLRPDFYDTSSKDENVYMKEKKEREYETQKVLKEIRDKRKTRLRRERSLSKEKQLETNKIDEETKKNQDEETLNSIKKINDYVNVAQTNNSSSTIKHDYVNVPAENENQTNNNVVLKKDRPSKIARPKSYPVEEKSSPEKESKISKLRRGFVRQSSKEKTKDDKNEINKTINENEKGHKNKLLQSIEKKLEKFRECTQKSTVDNTIKRLREQSLPRNLEPCTESGLIKRAVSVEDLTQTNNKPLQASRKSVTKILSLFKKYEEQDNKKKVLKKSKNGKISSEIKNNNQTPSDTTESVILSNNVNETKVNWKNDASQINDNNNKKIERPRSLLFDKMKHFQNGSAKCSDSVIVNESKIKSKLPRRSLNLEETPKLNTINNNINNCNDVETKLDRNNLKLDLNRIPSRISTPGTSTDNTNHYHNTTLLSPDENSTNFLSPTDDLSDSWSICSDLHSPNGHLYSGDENESVIDRIRRKSFYTRFNEKKQRPRRTSVVRNYKDLDVYNYNKPVNDYSSLDRRTNLRRSSYGTTNNEQTKTDYKTYTRSASLLNDYVNLPNRYGMKMHKTTNLFSDHEDNSVDDYLTTAKSRRYSPHIQPSRLSRTSVSPVSFNENSLVSSYNHNNNNNNNSTDAL